MEIKILIADDHGVLRAGLRALLNDTPHLRVVGEAANGDQAVQLARQLHPDVVLLDMNMPGTNGIAVTEKLHTLLPQTRILILTVYEDANLVTEVIRAGAAGYIIKRAVEAELINAIDAVCRGDIYIHPAMTRAFLKNAPATSGSTKPNATLLSERETQVLQLIAQGNTNQQIADALNLSVRTVETHRSNLMDKLGLRTRVDLVRYAKDKNLI